MQQNRSRNLMVSLCGLALSSLFILNNKSVVHADTTTDTNQNSAISWDSDSDAAQGVQNTQKADDNQQNVQYVQPSRAETSNVESSSANRSTTVQNNADSARTAYDIKVANVDTAEPAVVKQSQAGYSETLSNLGSNTNLGDLGVYDVSPDGVKSNIQSQVQSQLAINDASLANFNMNKDASGNLTASFGVYSNRAKQQNWWTNVKVNNTTVPGIQWRSNEGTASDGNLHLASTGQPIVYSVGIHKLSGAVIHNPANNQVHVHYVKTDGTDITDSTGKPINIGDYDIDTNKTIVNGQYQVPKDYQLSQSKGTYNVLVNDLGTSIGTETASRAYKTMPGNAVRDLARAFNITNYSSDNDAATKIKDLLNKNGRWLGYEYGADSAPVFFTTSNSPSYFGPEDKTGKIVISDVRKHPALWKFIQAAGLGDPGHFFAWDMGFETKYDYIFADSSGDVVSTKDNVVNLAVTKPQHVDPATDARMKATATRTIQINFPGAIPPSYKNIVNDKGVLTQTVTFTRTGQEDALTGDLIDSTLTPWKSNNQDPNFIGFPERTLPRIPGYTLSIKPA